MKYAYGANAPESFEFDPSLTHAENFIVSMEYSDTISNADYMAGKKFPETPGPVWTSYFGHFKINGERQFDNYGRPTSAVMFQGFADGSRIRNKRGGDIVALPIS